MEKVFQPKFLDKEILEKRKEKLKEQYTSLEEGVYIQGEIKSFERQDILGIISMMTPEDFVVMPEEYALVKYPSTFRPQHIITNLNLNVNMGFSVFPDNLKEKDAEGATNRVLEVLYSEGAGLDFSACKKLENLEGYWFDFRNHAMDQDVYNMLLIVLIKQKVLQITFNCNIQEQLDWEPVVTQMWESIEAIREEQN